MKYVVAKDEDGKEEIFIFPKTINHDDFAEALRYVKTRPANNHREWFRKSRTFIAAGFTDGTRCTGRSETLDLDSRGRLDELLIEG